MSVRMCMCVCTYEWNEICNNWSVSDEEKVVVDGFATSRKLVEYFI